MIRTFIRDQLTVDSSELNRLGPVAYILGRTAKFLAAGVLLVGVRFLLWRVIDPRFAHGIAAGYLAIVVLLPLTVLALNIVAVWRALHGRR
jgi:hypothetical protein